MTRLKKTKVAGFLDDLQASVCSSGQGRKLNRAPL